MTKPTFIDSFNATYSTTVAGVSKSTALFNVIAGDILVVCSTGEASNFNLDAPTGSGLTYTQQQLNDANSANEAITGIWTAAAIVAVPVTVSQTFTGSGTRYWGFTVLQFRGSDGVGNSSQTLTETSGTPSLSVTTSQANSALVCVNADWNAADGTVRTWRSVNSITPTTGNALERRYDFDSSAMTSYVAYWDDAGAIGAKAVGLSAPAGQKIATVALEIKGSAAVSVSVDVTTNVATLATGNPDFILNANVSFPGTFVQAFTADVVVRGGLSHTAATTNLMTASTGDVSVTADVRIPSLVPIHPAAFLPFLVR